MLPAHVDVSPETLRAIADRHGIDPFTAQHRPQNGIFNATFRLGDAAIRRIPRNHPTFVEAARHETVAVQAARALDHQPALTIEAGIGGSRHA